MSTEKAKKLTVISLIIVTLILFVLLLIRLTAAYIETHEIVCVDTGTVKDMLSVKGDELNVLLENGVERIVHIPRGEIHPGKELCFEYTIVEKEVP